MIIKRLMSLMLMMCMTIGMMPLSVYAEETEPEASATAVIEEAETVEAEESEIQPVTAESETSAPEAEIQAVTKPTQLWVEPTETNGIPAKIDLFKKTIRLNNYSTKVVYQLYIPGNVNAENIMLSWDGGAQATVDNTVYISGNCPIPPVGTEKSYVFKNGNQTLDTFNLITYQGSANVEPIFIDIDETHGTIAAMDGDHNHNEECKGSIYFNNQWYEMPKIKGRGNYTWWSSDDKKAYNITLGTKTTFPGIDSASTKKWSILAEVADHSLLCNRSGFSLAHDLGIGQDTASADVWMNGEYQGCYTVTPKTDSFVTKDGYMIEQDNYLEPEGGDPQFKLEGLDEPGSSGSGVYNRITVKKIGDNLFPKDSNGEVDDSDENIAAVADNIRLWLQDAWDAIRSTTGFNSKGKYYTEYIDIESFAKMYLMHEYVKSFDVCAGSILFHRDGKEDSDKLIAGPIWDLDNAMGSTSPNNSLGSGADRRSGQGSFIPIITEYKTSIYKTIYTLHADFRDEVQLQYNKNRDAFQALEENTAAMISEIEASALMNHMKVNEISYNNHKYSKQTTLSSGQYQQIYLATTNSQTDWPNYAANLKTYIHARSLWFENTYYDPTYCAHTNLINPVWSWSDDCSAATVTFECENCGESVSFNGTITGSVLEADGKTITFTAAAELSGTSYTDTKTHDAYTVTFETDDHITVNVFYKNESAEPDETDVSSAVARNGESGNPVIDESAQVYYELIAEEGYAVDQVDVSGSYTSLEGPEDTGSENTYRITKIAGDLTVSVTAGEEITEPMANLDSTSLTVTGKIGVNFLFEIPEEIREDTYIGLTFHGEKKRYQASKAETDPETGHLMFTAYTAAREMRDPIYITVENEAGEFQNFESSGKIFTEGVNYTIEKYFTAAKRLNKEKLTALVNAMDTYGKATQKYFGYNTDQFTEYTAPAEVTREQLSAFKPSSDRVLEGITVDSMYLSLETDTGVEAVLILKDGHSIEEYEIKVDGKILTPRAASEENKYTVKMTGAAADDLDKKINMTIRNVETNEEQQIVYYPLSYARTVILTQGDNTFKPYLKDVCRAMYYYWDAAEQYFE